MYHTALKHTQLSGIAEIFIYYWLEEHLQSLSWGSLIKNEQALQNSGLEISYHHKALNKLWAYIYIHANSVSTVYLEQLYQVPKHCLNKEQHIPDPADTHGIHNDQFNKICIAFFREHWLRCLKVPSKTLILNYIFLTLIIHVQQHKTMMSLAMG